MTTLLAKLDDVKEALGFAGSGEDGVLLRLLSSASASAERLVGVRLGRQVDRVVYPYAPASGAAMIWLDRWPIESVSSVQVGYQSRGVDAGDWVDLAVVDPARVVVDRAMGRLQLLGGPVWSSLSRANRVVFTCGFADPAVDPNTLPVTALPVPADLQRAVVTETVRLYNTRGDAGVTSVKAGKAGGHDTDQGGAHAMLREACFALRRVML